LLGISVIETELSFGEIQLERRKKNNQLVGRSPYMQAVHLLEDNCEIGDILNIKVFDADKNSLKGEVVQ